MFNMSSAMGKRWAEICTEVTARIKELGPNPVRARVKAPVSSEQ
jgi:coenzyme F420-reducing hydrogenase delta subunit